ENTGEEGIEHENDREESKEETVENETADAVVNTRGDYAGQEGVEHESDREEFEEKIIENNRWYQAWDRLREKAGWAPLSLGGLAVIIFCS
ncbi:unnamed protein product, partial [Ascophyllum nodosum]